MAKAKTMNIEITDEQIEALRRMAYSAGDMTQVALCEIALGDDESVEVLYEDLPHVRERVEALGVIADQADAGVRARALCARAIRDGIAAHGD